jgi:hypothetical protein
MLHGVPSSSAHPFLFALWSLRVSLPLWLFLFFPNNSGGCFRPKSLTLFYLPVATGGVRPQDGINKQAADYYVYMPHNDVIMRHGTIR